jgi:tRNA dimethylallyltransferase
MRKVLVIAGPTASGKSAFAIDCATKFNGEVINGDSQQVYRQLNIGTAKITEEEMAGVTHHLLDILDVDQSFSVADFQKEARYFIEKVSLRNKLPILCGGSGHYLKAVLYDYEFLKDDFIEDTFEELDDQSLYDRLFQLDPTSALKTHPNNRKRVLRALNLGLNGPLKSQREATQNHQPIYDVFIVVLNIERDLLNQRIEQRVSKMMDQGLVDEVKAIFSTLQAQSYQSFLGIGYKEFRGFLNGTETIQQAQEAIVTHTRQFAKRQLTWFRHQFTAHWINPLNQEDVNHLQNELSHWLKQEKE